MTFEVSAKLKTGQKPKSIKSITKPKNILSIKFPKVPARIKLRANFSWLETFFQ